jgi:predicted lipoprotein with Yx(FWY)xxD motif
MRIAAVAAVLLSASTAVAAPQTVPQGVTLVEVVRELSSSQPEFLWMRPGDPDGRTLFTSAKDAPGVSHCTAACAQEWIPFAVVPGAKSFGDWTVIKRADGKQQWAYRGQPLYTWVKEEVPGDVATTVGVKEVFNSKLAENARKLSELEPPADWKVARFEAASNCAVPDGVDIRSVAGAQGVILTDYAGLTLYAYAGDAKKDGQRCSSSGCNVTWMPLAAPALAANVGDFTLVARSDGTQQWAWQKKPLYRFKDDKLPGDVHGAGVDAKWAVAQLTEDFRPAGVDIAFHEGYGDALTVNGMTLYTGIAYEKRWGGRNLRDNYRNAYYRGKKLGGNTCMTADCLTRWKPFAAPASAVASGFWEPITREDGTKQWAYKGYALYTHTGDKAPGDMNGNDAYDIADYNDVSDAAYKRNALLVEVNGVNSVYWHIAKP